FSLILCSLPKLAHLRVLPFQMDCLDTPGCSFLRQLLNSRPRLTQEAFPHGPGNEGCRSPRWSGEVANLPPGMVTRHVLLMGGVPGTTSPLWRTSVAKLAWLAS